MASAECGLTTSEMTMWPGVDAVDGHVDDCADAVAVVIIDAELFHELGVACSDGCGRQPSP